MYNSIVAAVQSQILTNTDIVGVIPSGTTIQNMRNTHLGDTLTRDGYHLDRSLGRYIAGLTVFCAVTGCDPRDVGFYTHGMSERNKKIAVESVVRALAEPYCVSEIKV